MGSKTDVALAIETNGQELEQQFNRVVMALQYHDITRQQLEHVAQAFDSTRELVSSGGGGTVGLRAGPAGDLLHGTVSVQIEQT